MTRVVLIAIGVIFLAGCSSEKVQVRDSKTGLISGEVKYIELEGGFYGIVAGADQFYPVHLPDEFKKDGVKILFKYRRAKHLMSSVMWGMLIEVTVIEKQ